ncbi:hypothetical protein CLNEO_07340 [Anaerotignum neopropionicum]|uniref:BppU N-terminal domain-containing protein n=1 Tax=Anaerotignum neopropionicum TaxID=36847 RepID=A0A136WG25_9FIRM|nr:BppU family phage baseplate upper protein [Anaerotignum neopropionicum]KXL53508.1 hypothetical protein CLNEO_07340 [Anaerotignum neopropionicum]
MAQVFNKLYVDVRTETNDIITAVQNDSNSRFLDVFLLDNGLPIDLTGHDVRIYGAKHDGTEIYNDGTITEAANGRCQFELTDQALAVANDLTVQIVIYHDNVQILQSLPFKIHVVKSLISSSAIESSNEYGALVVLYQNLYEAYDLMTDMVQNMGKKGTIATERNVDTFWKMLEYMAKYLDTDLTTLLNTVLSEASVQGVIDRLGETTDTGGTTTAGTVMGKLNGLLSVKKYKVYKKLIATIPPGTTPKIILSVSGAGEFYGLQGTLTDVTVIADGVEYSSLSGGSNYIYKPSVASSVDGLFYASPSSSQMPSYSTGVMPFKDSFVVVVSGTAGANVGIAYALYE